MSKKTLGIALGGGGARGFAHIGVLKVLEEAGIEIDFIAGTSMGAIIGGLYARYQNTQIIHDKVQEFFTSNSKDQLGLKFLTPGSSETNSVFANFTKEIAERIILNVAKHRTGILNRSKLSDSLAFFTEDIPIENLEIPFCAVTTDLITGNTVEFSKGSLIKGMTASGAIPGFISPLKENGQLITDGGVSDPVPIESLITRSFDVTLGVSVDGITLPPLETQNIIAIQIRSQSILGKMLTELQLQKADIQMHPKIQYAHWSEFNKFDEFIQAGEEEARRHLPQLKEQLKGRFFWFGKSKKK